MTQPVSRPLIFGCGNLWEKLELCLFKFNIENYGSVKHLLAVFAAKLGYPDAVGTWEWWNMKQINYGNEGD